MTVTVLALRVLHVLLGAFWVGAALFAAVYLDPTVREMGPEGGRVMAVLARRGFQRTMVIVATITVVTGVYLLWQMSAGFSSPFMGSRPGILLSTGGLVGIIALGVAAHVVTPTGKRLGAIGAKVASMDGPPSPEDLTELARLQRKMTGALRTLAVLMLAATVLMALGPHV